MEDLVCWGTTFNVDHSCWGTGSDPSITVLILIEECFAVNCITEKTISLMPSAPSASAAPLHAQSRRQPPPSEPKEDGTAADLSSAPTALKPLHFGIQQQQGAARKALMVQFLLDFFFKKAPVKSMSITLKHASFRTNHFLSPAFISQILQGELH